MKILHIAEIKEVIGYGNSHPLRVKTEDNSTYVLKTSMTERLPTRMTTEFLSKRFHISFCKSLTLGIFPKSLI